MATGIRSIQGLLRRVRRDQKGITGLETAIVLIAFVVVASVFAYAVITTGLFSSEKAQQTAQSGVGAAKSTMSPKGSMILAKGLATGTASILGTAVLLTDTVNGDFVKDGLKVGETIKNITDGSSSTLTVVTDTVLTMGALTGGAGNIWALADAYEVDMNAVSTIKFKVTPSPGAEPFSLDSANTVVSFIDDSNNLNTTYAAAMPLGGLLDPFAAANTAYWTHTWLVGAGPGIETGDVVEFTVQVKNLTNRLTANSAFSVEIVPQSGAALSLSRTTPLEIALIMDVN